VTILYVDSPVNAIVKGFAVESKPMSPCHLTNEYLLLGIAYIVFTSEYGSSPSTYSTRPYALSMITLEYCTAFAFEQTMSVPF